ncbi:MAG TPA: DUF4392 domain-containing protein [Propionibacteriaceae bacterium]|nr:DUF4392 domain-containing protein [Propionibacteriaceae bacterium]HQE31678.1 DUF4392 domain-containing protein [Propionibacteriaceae bacterium]
MLADDVCVQVAKLAATDTGRGSERLAAPVLTDLRRAVESLLASCGDLRVAILTGFYIPRADPPAAETDGPLGAVQLAAVLQSLGGRVTVVTDSHCAPVLRGSLDATQPDPGAIPIDLLVCDDPAEITLDLTHAIAIERPGRSADGTYRNMYAADISGWCPPLDDWYAAVDAVTLAIGDGGNEVGMGRLDPALVAAVVASGDVVQSGVTCDALLVGGTSNWATHALSAALVASTGTRTGAACLTEVWCRDVLAAGIHAGAVDGVSAQSTLSIDGLAWPDYWRIPAAINDLLDPRPTPAR